MSKEAMKLALEALEEPKEHIAKHRRLEAITALKQALEQPEQEPVALPEKIYEFVPTPEPAKWHHPDCEGRCIACLIEQVVQEAYGSQGLGYLQRHLTTPPQRKPLTHEEIDNAVWHLGFGQLSPREVARAIEEAHGIRGKHD